MGRIIVDLDATCADIFTPWLEALNRDYGENLTVDDLTAWEMSEVTKNTRTPNEVFARPGFFRNLKPLPGAVEGVRSFVDHGHEVLVVTAAHDPPAFKEKCEWVHEHMPYVSKRHLVFMHQKHLIPADVFIDDSPKNADAYRAAHPRAFIASLWYPFHGGAGQRSYNWLQGNGAAARREAPWDGIAAVVLQTLSPCEHHGRVVCDRCP